MRYGGRARALLQRPGDELWSVAVAASARWRAGRRPVVAGIAGALCVLGAAGYGIGGLRPVLLSAGAVRAALPMATELGRLPISAFLPTVELPLAAAVVQVVVVFGLAELLLGRVSMVVLAAGAHVLSTLLARALIVLGTVWMVGLPASQAGVLDTGPSAMTTAVGAWLLLRVRALWCVSILGAGLVCAAMVQDNIDGREHLAAFGCGLIAPRLASVTCALLRRSARARVVVADRLGMLTPGSR
jgi:hypothetical protein